MPSMIKKRKHHSLVCVKSKLFAIGGAHHNTNCEFFYKTTNMFVTIKLPEFWSSNVEAVSVGSKIFVFSSFSPITLCYDVDKEKWSKKSCKATKNLQYYSSVKIPLY